VFKQKCIVSITSIVLIFLIYNSFISVTHAQPKMENDSSKIIENETMIENDILLRDMYIDDVYIDGELFVEGFYAKEGENLVTLLNNQAGN